MTRETAAQPRFTNAYHGVPAMPEVGQVHFRRNSVDVTARLNTGRPFGVIEGYGRTEAEAEATVRARAVELRGEESCPLCSKSLGGEKLFHTECARRENAEAV